jgi:putative IMPACT (imprinted ancient) family translation regulator
MTKLVPIAAGLQKKATRNLSKQDLATLKRVLRKMHDNLTQEASERVPRSGTQGVPYLSPRAGRGRRAKRGG